MDSFERFGDDGLDSQQTCSLGCPVTTGAGPVFFPRQNHERSSRLLIVLRCVVDERLVTVGRREVTRVATFDPVEQLVLESNVRKGSTNHHLVIPATRPVRVEVAAIDTVRLKVLTRRGVGFDGAGW